MRESIIMLKSIKAIVFLFALSWGFTCLSAIAQPITNSDDNITLSGESLQGIGLDSVDVDEGFQKTPQLGITLEPQKESTTTEGEVLFEGLIEESEEEDSPIYTIEKINTNQGEGVNSQTGTISLPIF